MSKRLSVPPELQHLIEKRDRDDDRRQGEQRSGADRREDDLGPLGAIESTPDICEVPSDDRREGGERRQKKSRRARRRRKSDS
jgi:hypothetical protein